MGSLASELKAKVMTADAELYLLGCKAFSKSLNLAESTFLLVHAVRDREDLIYSLAHHYLKNCIVPDVTGVRLSSVRSDQELRADGRYQPAGSHGPIEGEEGHSNFANAIECTPSSPSPLESGGAAREAPDGQSLVASPLSSPVRSGAGLLRRADGLINTARPTAKPKSKIPLARHGRPRGPEAIALVNRDLFDSFKVRNGKPIGDLTMFEARQLAEVDEREGRILRAVVNHVSGWVEPERRIRDIIQPDFLAQLIAQNMEASDAA